MENLKKSGKYEEYKLKKATSRKKLRESKKEEEMKLSPAQLKQFTDARRAVVRERVRKHRQKLKAHTMDQNTDPNTKKFGYRSTNTLGKAAKKIERNLPAESLRRTAVLSKVIDNLDEADKLQIVNNITKGKHFIRQRLSNDFSIDIRAFYERDDISRVSPKMRDVKEYKCAQTGQTVLLPTRHMVLTIREVYAIFVEEKETSGKGMNFYLKFAMVLEFIISLAF